MNRIVVVGVGALGSHFIQFARNFEDCTLVAIDFDRTEQKNVLSQFHAKSGVNKNKALALQQLMNFAFGVRIEAIPRELGEVNARQLLGGATLVVDCLDNAPSRTIVQRWCRELGIPLLHGALAAGGVLGRVIWDDQFEVESSGGGATCEDGAHLPFIGMVSCQLAQSAKLYLESGKRLSFQILSQSHSTKI